MNDLLCPCGARLVRRYLTNEYGGPEPLPHAELRCTCGTVIPDWSPDYVWPDENSENNYERSEAKSNKGI